MNSVKEVFDKTMILALMEEPIEQSDLVFTALGESTAQHNQRLKTYFEGDEVAYQIIRWFVYHFHYVKYSLLKTMRTYSVVIHKVKVRSEVKDTIIMLNEQAVQALTLRYTSYEKIIQANVRVFKIMKKEQTLVSLFEALKLLEWTWKLDEAVEVLLQKVKLALLKVFPKSQPIGENNLYDFNHYQLCTFNGSFRVEKDIFWNKVSIRQEVIITNAIQFIDQEPDLVLRLEEKRDKLVFKKEEDDESDDEESDDEAYTSSEED